MLNNPCRENFEKMRQGRSIKSQPRCHGRGSGLPSLFKGSLNFRNLLSETHVRSGKVKVDEARLNG